MAFQTMHLKESIDLQTKTFNLDKRPYLYIHFEPYFKYESAGAIYGGGEMSYKNEGQVPASYMQTEFRVATDAQGEIDIKKDHKQKVGTEFPEVKTVFPKQVSEKIPIHPSISREAKFLFIEVLVTYSGIEKDKKYKEYKEYCYKFKQVYNIKIDSKMEKPILTELIDRDEDWDRNLDIKPCQLEKPDWRKFKDGLEKHFSSSVATTTIESWK